MNFLLLATALVLAVNRSTEIGISAETDRPVPIEFPEMHFGGIPWDGMAPHHYVDEIRFRPPVILAPPECILLSRDKVVTCSPGALLSGALEQITDGDKGHEKDSLVTLRGGPQWIQVDLCTTSAIYALALWHVRDKADMFRNVVIHASDDPQFESGVLVLFDNTTANPGSSACDGRDLPYMEHNFGLTIDARGAAARYVRCYSEGSKHEVTNRYVELEVWGVSLE